MPFDKILAYLTIFFLLLVIKGFYTRFFFFLDLITFKPLKTDLLLAPRLLNDGVCLC